MIFDPFDDYETRGYLRNRAGEKDFERIKYLEHRAFLAKLEEALGHLRKIERLTYRDVCDTHKTLFAAVYPWAGQDRAEIVPDIAVGKGAVLFAHPNDARIAVEHALAIGHDPSLMIRKVGEVMGYLAYAHPFLDGNGRTIMVVHTELAERAGIGIEWAATNKKDYLTALTCEIQNPDRGHLDAYLQPFLRKAMGYQKLAHHIAGTQGIDGSSDTSPSDTNVLGSFSEPIIQTRYREQMQKRQRHDSKK